MKAEGSHATIAAVWERKEPCLDGLILKAKSPRREVLVWLLREVESKDGKRPSVCLLRTVRGLLMLSNSAGTSDGVWTGDRGPQKVRLCMEAHVAVEMR